MVPARDPVPGHGPPRARRRRRSRRRRPRTRRWARPTTAWASIAFTRGRRGRGGAPDPEGARAGAAAPDRAVQPGPHRRGAGRRAGCRRRSTARSWRSTRTTARPASTWPSSGAQRGEREGYLGELRQAVEQAPDFGPPYFFLAREELGAGRLEEARDLASRGPQAWPVPPRSHPSGTTCWPTSTAGGATRRRPRRRRPRAGGWRPPSGRARRRGYSVWPPEEEARHGQVGGSGRRRSWPCRQRPRGGASRGGHRRGRKRPHPRGGAAPGLGGGGPRGPHRGGRRRGRGAVRSAGPPRGGSTSRAAPWCPA